MDNNLYNVPEIETDINDDIVQQEEDILDIPEIQMIETEISPIDEIKKEEKEIESETINNTELVIPMDNNNNETVTAKLNLHDIIAEAAKDNKIDIYDKGLVFNYVSGPIAKFITRMAVLGAAIFLFGFAPKVSTEDKTTITLIMTAILGYSETKQSEERPR